MSKKNVRMIEIVQQVGRIKPADLETLCRTWSQVEKWVYIVHDRDVKEDGSPVASHTHMYLNFRNPVSLSTICNKMQVTENSLQFIKSWVGCLSYLTHEGQDGKYRYDPQQVVSNYDWAADKNAGAGKRGRKTDGRKDDIIRSIVGGSIREYNFTEYITGEEYVKYKKAIEDSFKYRTEVLRQGASSGGRNMKAVFVTGSSGSGKTTYAKYLAQQKGLSFFVSSGSNDPLDGYAGQDCIILDDLRGSCMGLSDLLKMLDNNTQSTVKSRYKNKFLECSLIIITTVLEIEDFYKGVFENENEPITQFKRRCGLYVRVGHTSLEMRLYDPYRADYGDVFEVPNPVADLVKPEPATLEKQLEMLVGFGVDVSQIKMPEVRVKPVDLVQVGVFDSDGDELPF